MTTDDSTTTDAAPEDVAAGAWTIEVSEREASTLAVKLAKGGAVTGTMTYEDTSGPLTGTWDYARPVLTLKLESRLGLRAQPLNFEIVLSGGTPLLGTDDQGHHFTLTKGS